MKKTLSKILSVFLAVLTLLGSAPLSGFVDMKLPVYGNEEEEKDSPILDFFRNLSFNSKAAEYTSDIYTYTLSSDNKATITKVASTVSGDIIIPATLDEYPVVKIGSSAFEGKANITSVVIPDSVTDIYSYAFKNCTRLESVHLGRVQSLGSHIFDGCKSLTGSITIPSTLKSSGSAFRGSSVTSAVFEKGIENIPNDIFNNCTTLASVTLPEKDDIIDGYSIGSSAFEGTAITEINIPDSLTRINSYAFKNCIRLATFDLKNVQHLGSYVFDGCKSLTSITIPATITSSGSAFRGSYIETATFEEGITNIPNDIFNGCTTLKKATLPEKTDALAEYSIGSSAFENTALEEINLPESLTKINSYAFKNCIKLPSIDLKNIQYLGSYVFDGCKSLTEITIPSTLVGAGSAFRGSSVTTATFEKGIANIPNDIFNNCTTLTKVTLPEKEDTLDGYKIGQHAFSNTSLSEIDLPKSLTTIDNYAFENCTRLASIDLKNIQSLGYRVFSGCKSLTEITIPKTLTNSGEAFLDSYITTAVFEKGIANIPNNIFNECKTLTKVTIPEKDDTLEGYKIGQHAFRNTSLSEIDLPKSLTAIDNYAFENCALLKNVTIPENVVTIGYRVFADCSRLESIDLGNAEKIGSEVIAECTLIKEITIPNTVTSNESILRESSVTSVIFEEGIANIPNYICADCTTLTSVKLPEKADTIDGYKIGYAAFSNTSLSEIDFPKSLTMIDSYAFEDCTLLTKVTIPENVKTVGYRAFAGCTRLESIDLGKAEKLGSELIAGCNLIKEITIPNTVTSNESVLRDSSVTSVVFEEGIANIPAYICDDCTTLTSVKIPEKADTVDGYKIGQHAFSNTSLSEIELPKSLTYIDSYAFEGCTLIKEVKIPENVTHIGYRAFADCARLESIDLANIQTYGSEVFAGCSALSEVTVPNTAKGSESLFRDSFVTKVIFEEGIANIPAYICADCETLTTVVIPEKKDSVDGYKIGRSAFNNCIYLTDVILPLSLTAIDYYAFEGCLSLGKITLPESLTSLADTAFENANARMHIPAEDSQIAITLINNEIPFTSTETGIKDDVTRYLNRNNTSYYTTFSTVSSSGLITLTAKYDFKPAFSKSVSDLKVKIRIPSTVMLAMDTVKLNGAAVEATFEDNILTINTDEKSGTVTFSIKPESSEYLTTYALLEYRFNGSRKTETIGIVNMATKVLTLDVPDETSKSRINVTGVASPEETVEIFVDGESMGTCTASKVGNYSKSVALKSPVNGKVYTIEVKITEEDGTEKVVTDYVTYNVDTLKMTSCIMYYAGNEYNMLDMSGSSPVVTWNGGSFTFYVTFDNPSIISDLYIVSTKGDEVVKIKAVYDESAKAFVATGFDEYLPGTISIDYIADNGEYIYDTDTLIKPEEIKNITSEIIKDSDVQIKVNDYDEKTGTGRIESTITLSEYDNLAFDYIYESKDISGTSVSESQLVKDGYTKIKKSDNSYYYSKYTESGNSTKVETVQFNPYGEAIESAYYEILNQGVSAVFKIPEPVSLAINTGLGFIDIGKTHMQSADIRRQIMSMNISDSEKQARIAALEQVTAQTTMLKFMSMATSAACSAISIANPPLGFLLGIANALAWGYIDANMENLYNNMAKNLLSMTFRFAVDPSGFVFEATATNRLTGVKATAYYKLSADDTAKLWDATEYEQQNPLYTDANGCYAWDVPEGLWQVKFEKEGYETTYSEWLPVPPPQLDVNIGMNSLAAPEVEYINAYDDSIEIAFSQYMNIDSINSENVVFTVNGAEVSGEFEVVDAAYNYEETTQYATTFTFVPKKEISGSVNVAISNAENYCGTKIANAYNADHDIILRIDTLTVAETVSAGYKAEKNIVVTAFPAAAASGKTVTVTMSNTYIATAENTVLTFDENGKATLKVTAVLPGNVDITFSVDDTMLTATTTLEVSMEEEPEHTHEYAETVTAPTCTSKGYTTYTCECGDSYTDNETDALAHTPEVIPGKPATEKETGLTDGEKCSVCGTVTKEQTEIPVLDHTHNYTTTVTEPTCTEKGYTTYTCACGDSYTDNEVDALGHTAEVIPGKPATETETGLTDGEKCSVCGTVTKEQTEIPVLEHTHKYDAGVVTAPTCTEKGFTTYTCNCGESYTDNEVNATGHTPVVIPGKPATEKETGLTDGEKCSVCGTVTKEQTEIPVLPHKHDYVKVTTAPTCTEKGFTTYTCNCGDSYTDNQVAAKGHTPGNWETVKAAQIGVKGLEQQKCTVCSIKVNEREIPALKEPEVTVKKGDLNNDGKVTAADARSALRISAKLEKATDIQLKAADANGDNKVTAADARLILRVSAKLDTF